MSVEGPATGAFIGATLDWEQGQVQHSPAEQVLQELVNPVTDGLSADFLARHSQDRSLLQSLRGQFGREIERDEHMMREQRTRERTEREEREMQQAERWPQQRNAVIAHPQWFREPAGCVQTTQALCSHSSVPDSRDSNICRGSMSNRDFGTDSAESTDYSLLALEQRVVEACAMVARVIREREEREQFGREIERKEQMIREQRARERREREEKEMRETERWAQQQDAVIADPQWLCEPRGCSQTTQAFCSHSRVPDSRDSNISRGSIISRDFGTDSTDSTGNSLLALEQSVTDQACSLLEQVIKEREEREQFEREIDRKEQMIREQRARERREREEGEMREAESWPQQQDAITPRSQRLCEHYQQYCRVRFPCCTQFYPCHRCHNNSRACDNKEAKACHATHLQCSHCHHEQEVII